MNEKLTAFVGAKISEFRKKMAVVNRTIKRTALGTDVPVGADVSELMKKMSTVQALKKIAEKKVVIPIEARVNRFQKTISRIANFTEALGTVSRSTLGGVGLMVSPALVPILASAVGLIGALGPMVGVAAASTFALASAFGLAGIAAIAFGAAAIPTITKLFEENAKLNAQQKAARAEYDKFVSTWKGITKELENPVLEAFGKSMQFATRVLELARPLFTNVGVSVNRLLDSLNKSMSSPPVLFFFEYMNKTAGPMLEMIGKSFGNFMQGFMSMMMAFGPLSASTAQGFLNMSQGFADWAAGLSKSEKFQAFIRYVNENMPKVRAIFRDAIAGITYFFAAFGPLSSDMMTGLQELMARFKEWAANLQSNQAFQNFIGYIRENAPKVLQLIGNLATFITNLGIALAPLGSKILDIVNKFLSWSNAMMESNPWFGKVLGGVLLLIGGFIAIVPWIAAFSAAFSGVGPILGKVMTWMGKLAGRALMMGARVALSWLIAMGPVGWVIAIVAAVATAIALNWDSIKEWTIKTWKKVSSYVKEKMDKVVSDVKSLWGDAQAFLEGIDLMQIGKDIIQGLIDGISSMASSVADKVAGVAGGAVNAAKKLLQINSPSRVFKQIGVFTGEGLIVGIKRMTNPVKNVASKMAEATTQAFQNQRTELAFGTSSATSSVVNESIRRIEIDDNSAPQEINFPKVIGAVLEVAGYEADGIVKFITERQDRNVERTKAFGR